MTCEKCGVELQIGDYPFCPHGQGHNSVIGDECDIIQENGFAHPRRFTSKAERLRALKEAGFQETVKNAGPDDKHCKRWDITDPQTLENARILVSRNGTAKGKITDPPETLHIRYVEGIV